MKDQVQLEASIDRFRRGLWNKETLDHPPIGIAADRAWLPINYLRQPFSRSEISPADVNRELARTDYEDSFVQRKVKSDDWLPYVAAWRAIPWLEAMCGCPVRYSAGSLAAQHWVKSAEDLAKIAIPTRRDWLEKLQQQTVELLQTLPPDCWVSPTILRGPSDVLGAIRGLANFYLDLYDNPDALAATAARVNQLHLEVLDWHFSIVKPKLGGYGHIYGYWAPGKTTVIQEDAMGMCSPTTYHDLFMPFSEQIVEHLGPYVFFHLHSTGYKHYPYPLEIQGLAGLEITIEANGPSLFEMLPVLREILERSRLILFVDSFFEQLPIILKQLPMEGLYLIISDKFILTELQFQQFLDTNW